MSSFAGQAIGPIRFRFGPEFFTKQLCRCFGVFNSGEDIDLFEEYFELKEQLEKIFRRQVDLVVDKKFKNPVLRESVDMTRMVIYER